MYDKEDRKTQLMKNREEWRQIVQETKAYPEL
jgi:hypothetical protein